MLLDRLTSPTRTIWRTPLTALGAATSTFFTRPPKTGDCARVAISGHWGMLYIN
jgi:hypothetical protein